MTGGVGVGGAGVGFVLIHAGALLAVSPLLVVADTIKQVPTTSGRHFGVFATAALAMKKPFAS
jgi:ascorbate-specific PTS system EIIC-type component UlaA